MVFEVHVNLWGEQVLPHRPFAPAAHNGQKCHGIGSETSTRGMWTKWNEEQISAAKKSFDTKLTDIFARPKQIKGSFHVSDHTDQAGIRDALGSYRA